MRACTQLKFTILFYSPASPPFLFLEQHIVTLQIAIGYIFSSPPVVLFSRWARFQVITAPVESTGMGDLLEELLKLDPKLRFTATEALKHRFFAEGL